MISAGTWANIIVAVLKVATMLLGSIQRSQQFAAGEDRAIGEQALATLRLTAWGKAISQKLDGMSDEQLDQNADDLGRP